MALLGSWHFLDKAQADVASWQCMHLIDARMLFNIHYLIVANPHTSITLRQDIHSLTAPAPVIGLAATIKLFKRLPTIHLMVGQCCFAAVHRWLQFGLHLQHSHMGCSRLSSHCSMTWSQWLVVETQWIGTGVRCGLILLMA